QRLLPCLPPNPPEGLEADDIEKEIDAVLIEELPSMPLLHAIDDVTIDDHFSPGGSRAEARRLEPEATYLPESYGRVVKHLEKLLHSKGYLNAVVGPVGVVRAECDPSARGGRCEPFELPPLAPSLCRRDALELPIAEPRLSEELTCQPDPLRSIHCAPTMTLHLPIQLGPQTQLYDLVFEGNETVESQTLVEVAEFELGAPFSNIELDAAKRRIVNTYRDRGYAYVTVSTEVDYSPDRTRARARIIINEHEPVIISGYEIRGASRTEESVIIRRLALCQDLAACADEDKYYRRNLVRESEEQIATLGTFSSVSIGLEDPDVPQKHKRVIITVVEQPSQYLEPRIGFSTGEGLRVALEYGHRNIAGRAIGLTLRVEFATLPDFLILDEDVRETYQDFTVSERLERRNSASLRFPDVGLGPRVDVVIDGIDVRDNQRDFGLTREALIPTLSWRPVRQVTNQVGASVELNDVTLFHADDIEEAIADNASLAKFLRVPEGRTIAFSQRLGTSWDRRDNPLAATSGTLLTAAVEHVTAMPLEPLGAEAEAARQAALPDGCEASEDLTSEFLRLTTRMAGYVRLTDGGMALAISVGAGYNVQLACWSRTYPDRLFYLGGVNTVRGFQLDEMVPEDVAQKILKGELDISAVGIRGGNLFVNPRAELRVPLTDVFGVGLFLDTGNVWTSTDSLESVFDLMMLRYAVGGGLRIATPIGPVALDYGFKLVRRDWEDLGALHFSIGLF
ncbi:MAG: BamA/TamA family outer membrane protein, partial [Deltaproteobacteria bacterium]|nr:BamA/TamA family outer membrane protein [Deltaproteobacteria bacterium]